MEYDVLEAICIRENLEDKLTPKEAYYVEMWQAGFSSLRLLYHRSNFDIRDYLNNCLIEQFEKEKGLTI